MPAAIITRHEIKHGCGTFPTKPPGPNQYSRYSTRSSTIPHWQVTPGKAALSSASALTENEHKPNLLKSDSVPSGLFLGNKPAEHPGQIESSMMKQVLPVPEEEVQEPENKPVELEEMHATTGVVADHLDDIQQFYHTEQFSPNVRAIWKCLTGPTPAKSHMEFHGVGAREFELLEHAVRETGRVPTKPRLTYDFNKRVLAIDMPTILHESFYDDLKESFTLAINNLPYDRKTIRPQIHMNYPLQLEDRSMTPDMVISLTATRGPTEVVFIPFIGETALTEEWDHVFEKVESMIAEYPEVILASIVLVREAKRYASPPDGKSIASETLHNWTDGKISEKPKPLPLSAFIKRRSTPRTFEEPVKIAGHTWCHVQSVEYFLWFKGEQDKPIDMRNGKAEHRAHGTLMPEVHMDGITNILDKALGEMRTMFLKFQKSLNNNPIIAHSVLEKFDIPPFPVDWELGALGVMTALDLTAHLRYVTWHAVRFRGVKRSRDSSYAPSESEHESSSDAMQASGSKVASAPKGPPSRHAFQTITLDAIAPAPTPVGGDKKSGSKSTKASTARKSKSSKSTSKTKGGHNRKGPNKRAKA